MKLEMVKGQEASLVIEDVVKSIQEDGFLSGSYSKALYALHDYVRRSDWIRKDLRQEKCPSVRNGILYRSPQNIIAFSGKRGSGKSSAMLSFSDALNHPEKLAALYSRFGTCDENRDNSGLKNMRFVSLTPIDPTTLEKHQSILSAVLSRLLFQAEENWKNNFSFYGGFQDKESRKTQLLVSARQCLTGVHTIKSEKDVPQELSDLQKVGDSSILKNNLFDFVELFLQFNCEETGENAGNHTGRSILVLQIDDTDCQIRQGYEVLEDIRKYLTIPNVLILMATDANLLRQVLTQHYVSDFSANLKENLTGIKTLRHLGEKHLSKLIPPSYVVRLPSIDDVIRGKQLNSLRLCYYEDKESKKDLLAPNAGEADGAYDFQPILLRYIYKKTHIVFTAHTAYANHMIPTTLRGLAYFLSLLSSMKDVPEVDPDRVLSEPNYLAKTLKAQLSVLEWNLDLFEDYFLHDWLQAKLPQDRIEIVEQLSNQAPDQRIPFIIKELTAYYGKRQVEQKTLNSFLALQNYDAPTYVELDELLRAIQGTHKSYKDIGFRQAEDFYFIFAIRTLLTIKNHRNVLRVKRLTVEDNSKDILIFDYLKERTSLPTGFYLDPVRLHGYQLVEGEGVRREVFVQSEYFKTERDRKFMKTAYFHTKGGRYCFNVTGGIIQWLAPKKEDYSAMNQLQIYMAQELAVLMAANCDVQEAARKAVARNARATPKDNKTSLKAAVESSFILIQNTIAGINQGMFPQYKSERKPAWKISKQVGNWLTAFEKLMDGIT